MHKTTSLYLDLCCTSCYRSSILILVKLRVPIPPRTLGNKVRVNNRLLHFSFVFDHQQVVSELWLLA